MLKDKKGKDCEICYQIKCRKCGWVADKKSTLEIAKGRMKECPLCNWSPSVL